MLRAHVEERICGFWRMISEAKNQADRDGAIQGLRGWRAVNYYNLTSEEREAIENFIELAKDDKQPLDVPF